MWKFFKRATVSRERKTLVEMLDDIVQEDIEEKQRLHNFSLDIGEPVLSLIESLRNAEGWKKQKVVSPRGAFCYIYRKDDLAVDFEVTYSSVTCLVPWMTNDEKELMEAVFYELQEKEEIEYKIKRMAELKAQRESFMVALAPSSTQEEK